MAPLLQGGHNKCISEGLMHVVARYRGTPGPNHEIRGISVN